MANKKNIMIIPGDKQGPVIIYEAIKILFFFNKKFNINLYFSYKDWGADTWINDGIGIPFNAIYNLKKNYNIIFLGILDDSRIPDLIHKKEILIKLKNNLNLYINIKSYLLINNKNIKNVINIRTNINKYKKNLKRNIYSINKIKRILYFAFRYATCFNRKKITVINNLNIYKIDKNIFKNILKYIAQKFPLINIEYFDIKKSKKISIKDLNYLDIIVTFNYNINLLSNLNYNFNIYSNCDIGSNIELFNLNDKSLSTCNLVNKNNQINAIYTVAIILKHLGKIKESVIIEKAIKKYLLDTNFIYSTNMLNCNKIGDTILKYIITKL